MKTHLGQLGLATLLILATEPTWADTTWQGTISSSVTWTKSGSPHIIADDVTIAAGVTVTIEGGAQVVMQPSKVLVINGRIMALGTVEDAISIGGVSSTARGGAISFASSRTSELRFCHFSHSDSVRIQATSPQGMHLLEHCVFTDVFGVLSGMWGAVLLDMAPARVLNCIFRDYESVGICIRSWAFTDDSTPMLYYNSFDKNGLRVTQAVEAGNDFGNRHFFRYNRVGVGNGIRINGLILNLLVSDCDLMEGISLDTCVQGLTVTNCNVKSIQGTCGTTVKSLINNYWGTNDLATIRSRVYGAPPAEFFEPISSSSLFPQADVDNSDAGNATKQADADLVKKYLVGLATLSPAQRQIADVDRDGKVDIRDALMIESYVKGLIWKLPPR